MEFHVAKNTDCRVVFPIMTNTGVPLSGAAGLDSEFALLGAHGGAAPFFADCAHEAVEIGSTGMYYLDVSAAEVNDDRAIIQVKSSSPGAVTQVLLFNTTIKAIVTDLAGMLEVDGAVKRYTANALERAPADTSTITVEQTNISTGV